MYRSRKYFYELSSKVWLGATREYWFFDGKEQGKAQTSQTSFGKSYGWTSDAFTAWVKCFLSLLNPIKLIFIINRNIFGSFFKTNKKLNFNHHFRRPLALEVLYTRSFPESDIPTQPQKTNDRHTRLFNTISDLKALKGWILLFFYL